MSAYFLEKQGFVIIIFAIMKICNYVVLDFWSAMTANNYDDSITRLFSDADSRPSFPELSGTVWLWIDYTSDDGNLEFLSDGTVNWNQQGFFTS